MDRVARRTRLATTLRSARKVHGWTLRQAANRVGQCGGVVDHSLISRLEHDAIHSPSFDAIRAVATAYNIPVQLLAEARELDFRNGRPVDRAAAAPEDLGREADEHLRQNRPDQALRLYDHALERLAEEGRSVSDLAQKLEVSQAVTLRRLGMPALAEAALRKFLRGRPADDPSEANLRALIALAGTYLALGDQFLASTTARSARELARQLASQRFEAMSVTILASAALDSGQVALATELYAEAVSMHDELDDEIEWLRARVNLAHCMIEGGKWKNARSTLVSCIRRARKGKYRRVEAQALTTMGQGFYKKSDHTSARRYFGESEAVLATGKGHSAEGDIAFVNAFYEWRMASDEGNSMRRRLFLARLRELNPRIERKRSEVRAFRRYLMKEEGNA